MTQCTCKKCGTMMVGFGGDDECFECAFPILRDASKAARQAVEDMHFEKTGEKKTAGELLRKALGM